VASRDRRLTGIELPRLRATPCPLIKGYFSALRGSWTNHRYYECNATSVV
jgi:hypothetical protein